MWNGQPHWYEYLDDDDEMPVRCGHPIECLTRATPLAVLEDDGALVCPHGRVEETESAWAASRRERAAHLIFFELEVFQHMGESVFRPVEEAEWSR